MQLSEKLWKDNADLAQACLTQPFVQGIGDGSLPRERFAWYIGQDAFYLQAFARAYTLASAKIADWQAFQELHELTGGVLQELELHKKVATDWGLNLEQIIPGPATRRYTDFLLATAWASEAGITIAAMTPCMRLYAWLGAQLAAQQRTAHTYSDWIQTYSSPDFEQLAVCLESLLDRYAPHNSATATVYRYAMECELDFFEAAWRAA